MKQIIFVFAAFIICGQSFSQTPLSYRFRKPTVVTANTAWKFSSVSSGIDAIVTITGSRNATLDKIDDSSAYAYAWNPAIRYTSTMTNNSDSSYLEFTIDFKKSSNGNASMQNLLAMTIIDCDGNTNFREMIKTSLPATSTGILGSLLNISQNSRWLTTLGSTIDIGGIDTSVYIAMTQINFTNVTSYKVRVGVLGRITANAVRQHSFYFKGFAAMSVPLPVELISFNSALENNNTKLTWSTASEENLKSFDIYRSLDGKNYIHAGKVNAIGNSMNLLNYNFTDYNVTLLNSSVVYYKLMMVDTEGKFKWSNISQVRFTADLKPASINVFPNPTTEIVNITLSETPANDIQVSIVDAFGKTITLVTNLEITTSNVISFDVKNLENGIYFINIQNADGSSTSSKFIKR